MTHGRTHRRCRTRSPTGVRSHAARRYKSTGGALAARRGQRRDRCEHRARGDAGLRHQHRLRQARKYPDRRRRSRARCNAISSSRTPPASASPRRTVFVRLMMALKIASLARGVSGVRPEILTLLAAMLARDVLPMVPSQGSVGASGDLAPLAHMAAAMIGEGEAFHRGERMPASAALARAASRQQRSPPRKAWRCSTVLNSPPPTP